MSVGNNFEIFLSSPGNHSTVPRAWHETAVSPIIGALLMVALVVLLALILLSLPHLCDPLPPTAIEVVLIHDYNEKGTVLNYDSRVLLRYLGTERLPNRPLSARFYVDDRLIKSEISTFHGESFIPTHHYGVERMEGLGCQGELWVPGAFVLIDIKDGTFRPGQAVRLDVADARTGCVISRDYYRATGPVR